MKTFSMTDKGITREINQDYVFTSEKPLGNLPNLFIVADGMGGHNAGDYASRCAVEVLTKEVMKCKEEQPAAIMRYAIEQANREILKKAEEDIWLLGMGTTVVMATLINNHLWVANVGDSRLYILNEEIKQITKDHSLVAEMVRRGELKQEEARLHPDKNVITRAVGAEPEIIIDIFELEIGADDQILMCSDGLTNMIDDAQILTLIRGQRDIVEKVEKLVERANQNGGRDNITVIVIEPFSDEVGTC